jgi:hypothetical protein
MSSGGLIIIKLEDFIRYNLLGTTYNSRRLLLSIGIFLFGWILIGISSISLWKKLSKSFNRSLKTTLMTLGLGIVFSAGTVLVLMMGLEIFIHLTYH